MHIGSCFCGAVKYEIHGEIGAAYYCHCSRCRKISGSAFSANAVVRKNDVVIVQGQESLKAFTSDTGVSRVFCSNCGSSIFVSQGNQMRLRLGTLDTVPPEPPGAHIFTGSKAEWFEILDQLPQHVEGF
jgi:hypothetical protein